jgi:AraC-like DNA-binding protein
MTPRLHRPHPNELQRVKNEQVVRWVKEDGKVLDCMNCCLDRIKDWAALAKAARYSATSVARQCGVSVRHLDRFFQTRLQKSPHTWLHELRMRRATELICAGSPLKQVAEELCYKGTAHFTRDFKKYFGVTPGQHSQQSVWLTATSQMSHLVNKCRI